MPAVVTSAVFAGDEQHFLILVFCLERIRRHTYQYLRRIVTRTIIVHEIKSRRSLSNLLSSLVSPTDLYRQSQLLLIEETCITVRYADVLVCVAFKRWWISPESSSKRSLKNVGIFIRQKLTQSFKPRQKRVHARKRESTCSVLLPTFGRVLSGVRG